jgi:preprotein translocase subunit SecD
MKGNDGIKFYTVVILTVIFALIAIYGFTVPGFGWRIPGASDIPTGIDIRGGVHTILYPASTEEVTQDQLDTAKQIIMNRLDNKNILDRTVTTDNVQKRIIVDIPWGKGETEFNPQATIKELGETALLTFQEVDENSKDDKSHYKPTGKIIIAGTDVVNAQPEPNPQGGMEVSLELTSEAAVKFEEATGRLINKPIGIFMDDRYISAPVVSTKIGGGKAVITLTPNKSRSAQVAEAKELADTIRAGALPFKLESKEVNSISPTLGENALKVTLNAGIVAFILIFFFMLLVYRLPGIIANIALIAHTALVVLFFAWMNLTLTLPGIAGIILSIGMAVDANVIIFERIKDELRMGRTLRAAIDVGFHKAFSAVLDANVTTLISALVLLYFGSGPIKSFALTLLLGVILSFLTAVTASRMMLKAVADVDIAKRRWLYGVKEG